MKCPYCGNEHEDDREYCPETGKILKVNCVNPVCKKLIDASYTFCPYCGEKVMVQDIEDIMGEHQNQTLQWFLSSRRSKDVGDQLSSVTTMADEVISHIKDSIQEFFESAPENNATSMQSWRRK